MANAAANRLVKYVLTLEENQGNAQIAANFTKSVEQSQKAATQIVQVESKERLEFEKSAAQRMEELHFKQLAVAEAHYRETAGIAEMMQNEITRKAEEAAKKREENEKGALRRIEEAYERQVGIIGAKSKEMNDGMLSAGEGVVKLGRGLAEVGILQEENAEEMLRALIAVQAAVDIAKGGVEVYRGIRTAVDAYRASVLAAAAAEELLAAARAKSAGAGAASGAAGAFGGASAGAASGAVSGLGTTLAGLGAVIASLPAAIAMAIAGVGAAGAMALNVGGIRDKTAQAMGEGGWFTPDSTSGWALGLLGRNEGGSFDLLGLEAMGAEQRAARASAETTDRRTRQRNAGLEMFGRQNADAQDMFDLQRQLQQMRMQRELTAESMAGGPTVDSVQNRLGIAQNSLQSADQQRARAEAMAPGMMRSAEIERASQAQIEALNQVIELRKQALTLEQQAGREATQNAKAELDAMQQKLDMRKAEKDQIESRLMSAQERFGQLDEETQRRTIDAMQRAQAGEDLSREDRNLLRGVGTSKASEFAKQGDLAAADAAGFKNLFGAEERAEIKRKADEMLELELKLKDQRDVVVRLEEDEAKQEQLVERVVEQVTALMDQRDTEIEQKLQRKLDQAAANRNNNMGGGLPRAGG